MNTEVLEILIGFWNFPWSIMVLKCMKNVYFKLCKLFSYETFDILEDLIKNVEVQTWKIFKRVDRGSKGIFQISCGEFQF